MNRRQFMLQGLVSATASLVSTKAIALNSFAAIEDLPDYGVIEPVTNDVIAKVVALMDRRCVADDFTIDDGRAAQLYFETLKRFAGVSNVAEAARSLFPEFRKELRVSIKVNTASDLMPSHPQVAYAVADSLIAAGLDPENIIIWERTEQTLREAGYQISSGPKQVKVIGTDTPGYGYDEEAEIDCHGVPLQLTSILTKHSDFQINLGVLKHHWFTAIATNLKNHYGSIPLVDRPFLTGPVDIVRVHKNACDPYIAKLNVAIEERVPTVLCICDALFGSYNNGPLGPPQWVVNEIWLSNDPVAMDTIALHKVEEKRREVGLPSLLHKARFIHTSAKLGLGTNNPEQMRIAYGEL